MKLTRFHFEQITSALAEAIAVVHVHDADWSVVWRNPAFDELIGQNCSKSETKSARALVGKLGGGETIKTVTAALSENASLEVLMHPISAAMPELTLSLSALLARDGTATGEFLFSFRPTSAPVVREEARELSDELANARARLHEISDDTATGLSSEERFRELLALATASAARESYGLSLLLFKMDGYPQYLETFGQHAADSCLRMLARTMQRRLRRGTDLAGRVGDSVIAALMHGGDEEAVAAFADVICADVAALRIHHPRSPVGRYVSVQGVFELLSPDSEEPAGDLLDRLRGPDEATAALAMLQADKKA